ncbi:MAG: SUMF1/EgtB/PvdO family nonheme iron enzyme [Planctomycetota bacterium]|nr:SUMF1/EgtB/PvdO family nonheme iron enzyme [Planctomycetota bacterium]
MDDHRTHAARLTTRRSRWSTCAIIAGAVASSASAFATPPSTDSSSAAEATAAVAIPGIPTDRVPVFKEPVPGTTVFLDMVLVPGGEFEPAGRPTGSESARVTIKPFYIARYEVTWDMYDSYVFALDGADSGAGSGGADAVARPSKPYIPPDRGFGHAGYPAISITYKGATEFCNWLSSKSGRRFRLATEAEWEWAARAGAPDKVAATTESAWSAANSPEKTQPVGAKAANAWGLHDMLGNVAEWTVGLDGKGVTRGGSFQTPMEDLGSETRESQTSAWNQTDPQVPKSRWWLSDGPMVGFRVVMDAEEGPPAR